MNKIFKNLALFLFVLITLYIMFSNGFMPREDEAHAWTIAGNTTFFQLINLMKVEGHFLVWFLILKPFAYFNLWYPYPLYIINWILVFGGIFILWEKAPFNNITKILITFSAPIIKMYAVQPRCYGVGILTLFIAMAMYENRLKNPYKYLICLIISANTNLPACIASACLGFMFLYDLIKSKCNKNIFYIIGAVLFFHLILYYFQFSGISLPDYESTEIVKSPYFVSAYLGLVPDIPLVHLWKIILLWIGTIVFPIILYKSKHALFFFAFTEITTLMFFTYVYEARIHHIAMLFIFAIIAFWIYKIEVKEELKFDYKSLALILLSLYMVFMKMEYSPCELKKIINTVIYDKNISSANIYTNLPPILLSPMLPILNHNVFNMNGEDLSSYEGLIVYFNKESKIINPDIFVSSLNPDKDNYIILNGLFATNHIDVGNCHFDVELYKLIPNNNVFKGIRIYKIKNLSGTCYQ